MEPKVIPTDFGKLVLDEMPGGAIVTTADGVVVYWNKGAQSIFGYTVAEALQSKLSELIGASDHQWKIGQSLKDALEVRASVGEMLCRKKDGLLIHVNLSCKVLPPEMLWQPTQAWKGKECMRRSHPLPDRCTQGNLFSFQISNCTGVSKNEIEIS